jgi:hypothetical protein
MEEQLTVSAEKKLDSINRLVKCECIANTQCALGLVKGTVCQIGDITKKKKTSSPPAFNISVCQLFLRFSNLQSLRININFVFFTVVTL